MGDQDSRQNLNEDWEDDKTRLLARKAAPKRSSLLRDAINAVDAALGSDRKSKHQDMANSPEALPVPDHSDARTLEPRNSHDMIEQALIEMKSQSDVNFNDSQEGREIQAATDSYSNTSTELQSYQPVHPLQGKVDPGRTQRVRAPSKGDRPAFVQEPVVAWLVIIQGPGLGAFRAIHEGNNTIGRALSQHVQLDFGDETISSEEQAYIRYDPQDRTYLFIPNLAKTNVVSVNEEKPTSAVKLSSMDIISMGQTRMAFIPFCGEEFDWSDI